MRKHPFWRGTLLAAGFVLPMTLGYAVNPLSADVDRFAMALTVMVLPGAFLASLPSRFRRGGERRHSTWKGCITGLLGGVLLALGGGMAGGAELLITGVMQGTISALAFAAMALLFGCAAAWITGGRKA